MIGVGVSEGAEFEQLSYGFSVNQALQLENRKLQSDVDKLKAEDQNKELKLQKLQ